MCIDDPSLCCPVLPLWLLHAVLPGQGQYAKAITATQGHTEGPSITIHIYIYIYIYTYIYIYANLLIAVVYIRTVLQVKIAMVILNFVRCEDVKM